MAAESSLKTGPISEDRTRLCMEATFQIDSMARALRHASRGDSESIEQLPSLVRSLMTRVIELNDALMMAVGSGDDVYPDSDLRLTVHGDQEEVAHG